MDNMTWMSSYLFNYIMIICFMSLFRVLDVYQSQFIVTLLFLSFIMFIDSFRGLGTSLVEGCAGDFRPNAAECERVHPSARQRASEGIRKSRSRTFAPMPRTTAQSCVWTDSQPVGRPNLANDRPIRAHFEFWANVRFLAYFSMGFELVRFYQGFISFIFIILIPIRVVNLLAYLKANFINKINQRDYFEETHIV